jgi:hypothetical protein
MGLSVIHVHGIGDGLVHALGGVAARESSAIGGGRPASPAELRAHLEDVLVTDLGRDPRERRFWPVLDGHFTVPRELGETADAAGPADGGGGLTDERGRALAAAITAPGRTTGADDLTLAAVAVVLGLRITVVPPDGVPVEFGPPSGRRAVLVRLAAPGRHSGSWGATEPVGNAGLSLAPAASGAPAPGAHPVPLGSQAAASSGTRVTAGPPPGRSSAPPTAGSRASDDRPPMAELGVDPFGRG